MKELETFINNEYQIPVLDIVLINKNDFSNVYLLRDIYFNKYILKEYRFFIKKSFFEKLYKVHNVIGLESAPDMIITKCGEIFSNYNGKKMVLYEFIENNPVAFFSRENISELGNVIGLMHEKLKAIPSKRNQIINVEKVLKLVEYLIIKLDCLCEVEKKFLITMIQIMDFSDYHKKQAIQYIHGDLNPNNILWNREKVVAIIDYDDVNENSFFVDLGAVIYYMLKENSTVSQNEIRIFLTAYNDKFSNMKYVDMIKLVIYFILNEIDKFSCNANYFLRKETMRKYFREILCSLYEFCIIYAHCGN